MSIKILDDIDVSPLLDYYYSISTSLEWLEDDKTKQCALQHLKSNPSFVDGCGRIKTEKDKFGRMKFLNKEQDFNMCHSLIQGSVFEDIIKKYKMYRTRLMWVKPKSCYSIHRDFGPRIHIPLITNNFAMFIFLESPPQHLKIGNVYQVDTRKLHSFANFGDSDRLHIIGCV